VGAGRRVFEVQGYNTPVPRDAAGGDAALLARLREAAGARSHDAIPHLTEALVDGLAEAMREYDAVRNAGRRRMPSSPPKTPAKTPEKTPVKQQRPPVVGAGWQPAAVDDLAEGDRVRLDVDGSPTEVVLTAPPAESVDDDQTIELEWRADDGREGVAAVGSDEAVFSPNSCCEALSRGPLRVLGGSGHQLVDDQRPCGDRRGDPRVPEVGEPSHRPSRRHENHGERDIVPLGDRREEEAAYHRRHDPEDCLRP
jgi:hypothetical protein